jgi:gentisate 1,2-dioxygenase
MDGLDIPINGYLDASFFEPYPSDQQPVTELEDGKHLKYGVGVLQPAWEARSDIYPPISTYKWADTERALTNLARVDASPFDDIALEFTNPQTGGTVMTTITCWIQMLRPGIKTQAHRQVTSAVYYAHEGQGATIVNGVRFDWGKGDMFVIPSWAWHEHHNESGSERAILFSIQDMPIMKALGKYREEAYAEHGGHQPITGVFTGQLPKQPQSK